MTTQSDPNSIYLLYYLCLLLIPNSEHIRYYTGRISLEVWGLSYKLTLLKSVMQNVYAFLRKMRQMMEKYRCYVGVRLIAVDQCNGKLFD